MSRIQVSIHLALSLKVQQNKCENKNEIDDSEEKPRIASVKWKRYFKKRIKDEASNQKLSSFFFMKNMPDRVLLYLLPNPSPSMNL